MNTVFLKSNINLGKKLKNYFSDFLNIRERRINKLKDLMQEGLEHNWGYTCSYKNDRWAIHEISHFYQRAKRLAQKWGLQEEEEVSKMARSVVAGYVAMLKIGYALNVYDFFQLGNTASKEELALINKLKVINERFSVANDGNILDDGGASYEERDQMQKELLKILGSPAKPRPVVYPKVIYTEDWSRRNDPNTVWVPDNDYGVHNY